MGCAVGRAQWGGRSGANASTGAVDRPRAAAMRTRMTPPPAGPDCTTMTHVRAGVDQVDRELVALLARRFAYMDAAARIKPHREAVRDEPRKAQVITNIRTAARAADLPEDALATLWDGLVEASIAYELEQFDRRRA